MISKNKIKLIRSLETKKGREKVGLFVAEGPKVVNDLLHEGFVADEILEDIEDIKKVSFLQHPQSVEEKTRRWNSGLFCRFQPTDTSDVALLFLLKFFDMNGAKKRGNCRCACTLYSS